MKWLSFVLLLYLPTLRLNAQARSREPMKKANRVIVINGLSAKDNYKSLFPILIDNGYSVDKKDDEFFIIRTLPRTPDGTSVNVAFNLAAKDSTVVISGSFTSLVTLSLAGAKIGDGYHDVEFIGMKHSDAKDAFRAMEQLASLIPGTVYYEKK